MSYICYFQEITNRTLPIILITYLNVIFNSTLEVKGYIMSFIWLFIHSLIAISAIFLVRTLGPFGITQYSMEDFYDSDSGYYNVFYRIIAPALTCTAFVSLIGLFVLSLGYRAPVYGFISLIFYWLLIAIIKIYRNTLINLFAFFLEATTSILIGVLFNQFIVYRIFNNDFSFIDNSSIAFQAEMALLIFIVQGIVSLITRYHNKDYRHFQSDTNYIDSKIFSNKINQHHLKAHIIEKKLYSYERRFANFLPKRFEDDFLLRCVFFSIMLIEDYNRPRIFRFFERIAFKLGIAHSTGIMQQKAKKALSDHESVQFAIDYIERMWDSFLIEFAKAAQSNYEPNIFKFTSLWYEYHLNTLAKITEESFELLYGDYCGTRLLNVNYIFHEVKIFYQRQHYGFLPEMIIASWKTPPYESYWYENKKIYWKDTHTSRLVDLPKNYSKLKKIIFYAEIDQSSIECINQLLEKIKTYSGLVSEVKFVENIYIRIIVHFQKLPKKQEISNQWKIMYENTDNEDEKHKGQNDLTHNL